MNSTDVLFFSPHPDDVELFCGATVACLSAAGLEVRIVDLTAGEMGSNGDVEGRRRESLRAAAALGVGGERPVLGLPDAGLDPDDEGQLRAVVRGLRRWRPRLVVAPWREDRHPDHVAAGDLASRAVPLAASERWPEEGPAHRVSQLLHYPCHAPVAVDVLVDVGEGMPAFRTAVACYASQLERAPGAVQTPINAPEFLRAHLARRRLWGAMAGCEWAEGFCVEGPLTLDLGSLFGRAGRGRPAADPSHSSGENA